MSAREKTELSMNIARNFSYIPIYLFLYRYASIREEKYIPTILPYPLG